MIAKRAVRVLCTLPAGWSDYPDETAGGASTYVRDASKIPGALQVSFTLYRGGPEPNPSEHDLEHLSAELGEAHGFGRLVQSEGGVCRFGRFGTAVFNSDELARAQVWNLSNGRDFILFTHICPSPPEPAEVEEAGQIVQSAVLTADEPKWKFWK